jgi:hypothetical protein
MSSLRRALGLIAQQWRLMLALIVIATFGLYGIQELFWYAIIPGRFGPIPIEQWVWIVGPVIALLRALLWGTVTALWLRRVTAGQSLSLLSVIGLFVAAAILLSLASYGIQALGLFPLLLYMAVGEGLGIRTSLAGIDLSALLWGSFLIALVDALLHATCVVIACARVRRPARTIDLTSAGTLIAFVAAFLVAETALLLGVYVLPWHPRKDAWAFEILQSLCLAVLWLTQATCLAAVLKSPSSALQLEQAAAS